MASAQQMGLLQSLQSEAGAAPVPWHYSSGAISPPPLSPSLSSSSTHHLLASGSDAFLSEELFFLFLGFHLRLLFYVLSHNGTGFLIHFLLWLELLRWTAHAIGDWLKELKKKKKHSSYRTGHWH